MQREGINVRYLGLVRKHVQRSEIKQFVLVEMVARVVKNMLRQKLRNKMKVLRTLEEGCYIKVSNYKRKEERDTFFYYIIIF